MYRNSSMPDYSKCVMYQIKCLDLDITKTYIGSTCNFNRRKSQHKYNTNTESGKKYNIRNNGGWNNFIINPIKTFPCNNKLEKLIEERRLMYELGAELNTRTPYKMIN